jgi:hypothetical protein
MPLTPYLAKALLDWSLGGATPTQPAARFIGLASGTPDTANDSAAPMFRRTATFSSASSPIGSAVLSAACTISATANCTVFYWNLFDGTTASTRLMFGSLTASHTIRSGSAAFFVAGTGAGGLTITLS